MFCDRCGKPGNTTEPCRFGRGTEHSFVVRLPGHYYCIGCGVTPEEAGEFCPTRQTHQFFHSGP